MQDKQPGNGIEVAIACIYECMRQKGYDMGEVKAAEWWAHKRAATDAHQLHFDLDESKIGAGSARYKLRHPVRPKFLVGR